MLTHEAPLHLRASEGAKNSGVGVVELELSEIAEERGWKPRTKSLRIRRQRQISQNDRQHFINWKWKRWKRGIHERRFFYPPDYERKTHTHADQSSSQSKEKIGKKTHPSCDKPWGRAEAPKVFVHSDSSYGNAKNWKMEDRQAGCLFDG